MTSIAPGGNDPSGDGWVAVTALHDLFTVTTPDLPSRARGRYEHDVMSFGFDRVNENDWSGWRSVEWTVDGHRLAATAFAFAGAWVAYTRTSDTIVQVLGVRDPVPVQLEQISDTAEYHFDAAQPIEFPETLQRSRTAAWGHPDPSENPWPRHADHDMFLN